MKTKKILFLMFSIFIFFASINYQSSYEAADSEFSTYSSINNKPHASTFTLSKDAELYFKYVAENLSEDAQVLLINLDTNEVIIDYDYLDRREILIRDIPKGKYSFNISFEDGSLFYRIYTKKKIAD